MSIQEIRDNLNIGLTLVNANHGFGLPLEDVLTQALGYIQGGPYPAGDRDSHISRLRQAQSVGNRNYALRVPGYFTINAQPFGNIFLYKSVWYTWLNPNTGRSSIVMVCTTDMAPMRRWRDQYLRTRIQTTRSVRAADNLERQSAALARGDTREVVSIQSGMVEDGTLSEVVTGMLGVPYVDVADMMNLLAQGNPYGTAQFSFTQRAQRIRQLENALAAEQAYVMRSLSNLVALRQNLPPNAIRLAIQDAQHRLANLP
jgi:hypothetical protein